MPGNLNVRQNPETPPHSPSKRFLNCGILYTLFAVVVNLKVSPVSGCPYNAHRNPDRKAPVNPSGISRRDLLKQMGYLSLALATPASTFPENRSPVTFSDVAAQAGITFRHVHAASTEKYLIETMGSGCGWIDYDQNGLLDLYLVNGAATRVYTPQKPLRSPLNHNNGDGTSTDVRHQTGVGAKGRYGIGVALGDYD